MLEARGPDLWLCEGPTVDFLGFPYPTRMAVVRLASGELWLWSPVEWSEALAAELERLGRVSQLVAPNKLHHLYLGEWADRFPEARLHASPGLVRKRPDLHFHSELSEAPDPAWEGEIDQVVFRGSRFMEEVVFFHRGSSTVLVCDLIQRMDPAGFSGWRGWLMRANGLVGPDGSTPLEWRASFLSRRRARAALRTALAWKPDHLVIAHGVLPEENGEQALARGLRWLR